MGEEKDKVAENKATKLTRVRTDVENSKMKRLKLMMVMLLPKIFSQSGVLIFYFLKRMTGPSGAG